MYESNGGPAGFQLAATLLNPSPEMDDLFGAAVAMSGEHIVVGAPNDDTVNVAQGAAHVFGDPDNLPPAPEIALEQPAGAGLTDGAASINFGTLMSGSISARTFAIKNLGVGNLTGLAVSIEGTGAFAVTAPPSASVAPGGSTTFTVAFLPTSIGTQSAMLRVTSNDADESSFDVVIFGAAITRLEMWRLAFFGNAANVGAGADLSDFDRDGLSNLLEFATHRDPTRPSGAIGTLSRNGGMLEFRYSRAKAAVLDGLRFFVEFRDALGSGSWQTQGVSELILSDNGIVQEVLATIPAGAGQRFVRLLVRAL